LNATRIPAWMAVLGMLIPAIAIAHGWKAPADAARIDSPVPYTEISRTRGKVYYSHFCIACHGERGRGDGATASALRTPPADLVARKATHSDGDFFWKIQKGKGLMPGFESQMEETQIWDVINYIKRLKQRRIERPAVSLDGTATD